MNKKKIWKNNYLFGLRNKFGTFKLQYLQKKDDGSVDRTKRYNLMWFFEYSSDTKEGSRRNWMFNQMNQRSLLPNELVFDFDGESKQVVRMRLREILNDRVAWNSIKGKQEVIEDYEPFAAVRYFQVFESNSGYHVHFLFAMPIDDEFRRRAINNIRNAAINTRSIDRQIRQNHMIAMEYEKHWKNPEIIKQPVKIKSVDTRWYDG